jgi:uncharacterized protein
MPGLVVTTGVRVGSTGTADAPSSSFFVSGTAERGPTDDYRLVRSVGEFESIYGEYDSTGTLYQHLQTFFEEGGTQAYVIRVVGTTATSASAITFKDAGANSGNTAVTVSPVGAGSWAENLSVTLNEGVISGTVRAKVTYKSEIVYISGDLTSNQAIAEALTAGAGNYVTATYSSSASLAYATGGVTKTFSGGNHQNATVTDAQLVSSLTAFVPELGAGVVAIPGTDTISRMTEAIWDGLQEHALDNNRIAFTSFAYNSAHSPTTSLDAAKTFLQVGAGSRAASGAGAYYGVSDAQQTDASVVAAYWPHVEVPNGTGGTRIISPESFAAAARARAHVASGLVFPVNSVVGGDANDARVNALRVIDNTVRVYGARSISADETNWRYITFRDVINYVVVQASARLEPFVFGVIDSRNTLFGSISAALVNLLEPLRRAGGIYEGRDARGNITDRGYIVEVSDALNPTQQLAEGTVTAKVGLRVSSVGETVNLIITKSGLTTAV